MERDGWVGDDDAFFGGGVPDYKVSAGNVELDHENVLAKHLSWLGEGAFDMSG